MMVPPIATSGMRGRHCGCIYVARLIMVRRGIPSSPRSCRAKEKRVMPTNHSQACVSASR